MSKQIRDELVRGAQAALENHKEPEKRMISVRALDLLAALGVPSESNTGSGIGKEPPAK